MDATFRNAWKANSGSWDATQVRVNVTHAGFNIATVPTTKYNKYYLGEIFFKLTGVLLIPAGGIMLFLPSFIHLGLMAGAPQWALQFGLLSAFVVVGVALHRWANVGFLPKVQVDSARSEVRIGTQNADGNFTLRATFPVSQIESFFIRRSSSPSAQAQLKMRLKTGPQTITVAEGSEHSLVPILERITLTLRPPGMKNRRVRTHTTGRFIRMTF